MAISHRPVNCLPSRQCCNCAIFYHPHYYDASVESAEFFTLDFSVNANGGNAMAGTGKPTLTVTIDDNDLAPANGTATGTGSIGTAAYIISASPFDAKQQSQRMQFAYKAAELNAAGIPAGSITALAIDLQKKLSVRAFTGLTIKLGTLTLPYLINGSINQGSGMTVVKSTASYNTTAGWNNFIFDSPYTWDGTSTLVVEFCFNNAASSAGDTLDQVLAYSDGGTAGQGNIFWQTVSTARRLLLQLIIMVVVLSPSSGLAMAFPRQRFRRH